MSWSRATGMAMTCTFTISLPSFSFRCFSKALIVS